MPELSAFKPALRLRVYINDSDCWKGKTLEAALLETLRAHGISGAIVFRGAAGYGAHASIHSASIDGLSVNLPLVVEAVDTPEKIEAILTEVDPMVREGLITVDEVRQRHAAVIEEYRLPVERRVSEAMTENVISMAPEAPISQAWKQMLEHRIKALPVVDKAGMVVGILTDEDLLARAGIRQRLSIAVRLDVSEINQELRFLEHSKVVAADVMTYPVLTALDTEPLSAATQHMLKAGLKRMPVVNESGRLVGMLSRLDILRQVANAPLDQAAAHPTAHAPAPTGRTVQEVMSAEVSLVAREDGLADIVAKILRSPSHRLIVVDADGIAIGLISDSDVVARVQPSQRMGILNALRQIGKSPLGSEKAADLMSPGLLTGRVDLPVFEALKQMLSEGRKYLVVVDGLGKPLGLVDRQIMLESMTTASPV
jgi:CBS-domain-containing membrane protein